jgi:hypothetical protein
MKKMVIVLVLLFATWTFAFSQVNLPEHRFVAGNWTVSGDRLYQNDEKAGLAKMNVKFPQDGAILYEFSARYEGGAEDGHGGFGLHFFAKSEFAYPSWGADQSYLIWLNYDEKPSDRNIPAGLSAQVYYSHTNTYMELLQSFDLNEYDPLLTDENLAEPVYFKIIVDGNTGVIQVFDPTTDDGSYYAIQLNTNNRPLKGDWIVLRTNGIKLSFSN